jgi:hypothetical protein
MPRLDSAFAYPFDDADQFFAYENIEDPMLRAYLYDQAGMPHARVIAQLEQADRGGTVVDELLRKLLLNEVADTLSGSKSHRLICSTIRRPRRGKQFGAKAGSFG